MKKIGLAMIFIVFAFIFFACQENTNTVQDTEYLTFPEINYADYSLDYLAIRSKDESGRTISIDYYYDNLEQVSSHVNTIVSELSSVSYNGGIGPISGRYNDGWIMLVAEDDTSLVLNLYLFEEYTILGLMLDQSSTEFFYQGLFDTQIIAIFSSFSI